MKLKWSNIPTASFNRVGCMRLNGKLIKVGWWIMQKGGRCWASLVYIFEGRSAAVDGSLGRESLQQVRWSETKRGSSSNRRRRRRQEWGRGRGKKRETAGTGKGQSVFAPPSESEKTAMQKGNRQCQPHQAKMEKNKSSKWQPLRETQPLSLWLVEKDVWVFAALGKAIGCLHV